MLGIHYAGGGKIVNPDSRYFELFCVVFLLKMFCSMPCGSMGQQLFSARLPVGITFSCPLTAVAVA